MSCNAYWKHNFYVDVMGSDYRLTKCPTIVRSQRASIDWHRTVKKKRRTQVPVIYNSIDIFQLLELYKSSENCLNSDSHPRFLYLNHSSRYPCSEYHLRCKSNNNLAGQIRLYGQNTPVFFLQNLTSQYHESIIPNPCMPGILYADRNTDRVQFKQHYVCVTTDRISYP